MEERYMTEKKSLGFIFNSDLSKVILKTVKDEGELQGMLNGISASTDVKGGTYLKSLIDKISDETGAEFDYQDFSDIGTINTPTGCIKVYYAKHDDIESLIANNDDLEVYASIVMHQHHNTAPLLSSIMGYITVADNQKIK